jgi:sodium-dependent phosphate transporter
MRSLGNKITQVSPTRGFAMELGAAITVLLASRLGLPVVSDDLQYLNRIIR